MPRALVNDMTVPPAELVELASILDGIGPGKGPAILNAADRKIVSWALRLASRQEVSVEAIAREFRSAMLDTPTDGGFNARATERERIADEYARTLLAKYSITKRTTEG